MEDYNVSKATLGRIPLYLKYLKTIASKNKTISATKIAKALEYGEVQVRKDLASVSGKGRPKIGYATQELIERLESFLGQNNTLRQVVLVGAGKLGRALLDYTGFAKFGLEISAAFDCALEKVSESEQGKPIYPMRDFADYCKSENIKVGIITVPYKVAQSVCDLMVENNITAIWSFAPENLKVPEGVLLEQENLGLSLAHLTNQI